MGSGHMSYVTMETASDAYIPHRRQMALSVPTSLSPLRPPPNSREIRFVAVIAYFGDVGWL